MVFLSWLKKMSMRTTTFPILVMKKTKVLKKKKARKEKKGA